MKIELNIMNLEGASTEDLYALRETISRVLEKRNLIIDQQLLDESEKHLIRGGFKIRAIKSLRDRFHHIGLIECKRIADDFEATLSGSVGR